MRVMYVASEATPFIKSGGLTGSWFITKRNTKKEC